LLLARIALAVVVTTGGGLVSPVLLPWLVITGGGEDAEVAEATDAGDNDSLPLPPLPISAV